MDMQTDVCMLRRAAEGAITLLLLLPTGGCDIMSGPSVAPLLPVTDTTDCTGASVNFPTTVRVGQRVALTLDASPGNCNLGDLSSTWTSSNPAVLRVMPTPLFGADLEGVARGSARVEVVVQHVRKGLLPTIISPDITVVR